MAIQLFTKNANQWQAKPITPEEADRFRAALSDLGISHPVAHDSYLIHLASPDRVLWHKSIDAFAVELRRAETLGIDYVVTPKGQEDGVDLDVINLRTLRGLVGQE